MHRPFICMQGREIRGELKRLRDANAYFEDEEHFEYLRQALLGFAAAARRPNAASLAHWGALYRQLCSFTHPDLAEIPDDVPQQYRGLKALKDALRTHLQRYFCDVCLEGRKVRTLSSRIATFKYKMHAWHHFPFWGIPWIAMTSAWGCYVDIASLFPSQTGSS